MNTAKEEFFGPTKNILMEPFDTFQKIRLMENATAARIKKTTVAERNSFFVFAKRPEAIRYAPTKIRSICQIKACKVNVQYSCTMPDGSTKAIIPPRRLYVVIKQNIPL